MDPRIQEYLQDPFLKRLSDDLRRAGPLRSISMDITHVCNIRCEGCYFFAEDMDQNKSPKDEAVFDEFIAQEKARGTNYITVLGGEPSLMQDRLKKLYDNFNLVCVTNGIRKIPYEGFENMPLAISVWGDHETDKKLRGNGKREIFKKALENYKNDPRAWWYFTVHAGNAHEIASVVEQCVDNGNYVHFNFFGDVNLSGGDTDHRQGFDRVLTEIDQVIDRFPERIFPSSYVASVVGQGELYDEKWGFDVCTSCSVDHAGNQERLQNGKPFNRHFKAFNPDLKSTRRCCVGEERDCSTCYDVWSHYSWIILNKHKHLGSKQEFTQWLTSKYLFYLINRIVDFEEGVKLLPEIHDRLGSSATEHIRARQKKVSEAGIYSV